MCDWIKVEMALNERICFVIWNIPIYHVHNETIIVVLNASLEQIVNMYVFESQL